MLKKFFSGIKEQAHLLGGMYYAWALISTLAGGAYSGYKLLATPAISGVSEYLFYAFVLLVVVVMTLVPLLAVSIFLKASSAATKTVVANPALEIRSRQVEYKIDRTGLVKSQKITLFAREPVNSFRLSVNLTGSGKSIVTPRSHGLTLLGPIARGGADAYELQFADAMSVGETRTIDFDIEVIDENGTMRPFLTDSFHNAASYGDFRAQYFFKVTPASVFSDTLSIGGESLGNMRHLLPKFVSGGALYEVNVSRIDHHCSYTVSWVW